MNFPTMEYAIAHFAKTTPDKICLIEAESGDERTYSRFWNQALFFCSRLKELGLRKGENVVVRVTQGIDTLVAAFGVHMAGGVYVPIAQKIGDERIKELLEYFEARFFVAVSPVKYDCCYIDMDSVCDESGRAFEGEVIMPDPEAVSDIFFTTGTTGTPKGVMLSYRGYVEAVKKWHSIMEFDSSDTFMSCNPQNLAGGLNFLRRSFLIGAASVIGVGVVFLNDFLRSVDEYNVTAISLRPAELSMLLNVEEEFKKHCGKLRALNLKTGAASVKNLKRLKELLPNTRIFNNYASTETFSMCSYEITGTDVARFCVGKPVEGVSIRIVDERGVPIENSSSDNPGIIACKSPSLMRGYWKNPELTASVMKDGWLMLTDMGYMDDKGLVYVMGRRDDVINTGGHKVAPAEIEDIASEIDGIKECACVSMPDDILGEVPKLFVVMADDREFSMKRIYDYLSVRIERYKLPRVIEKIDFIPKAEGNNKIKRRELKNL